jgi:endo-1,4-beta-xylanase
MRRAALLILSLGACAASPHHDPREVADRATLREAAGGRVHVGAAVDLSALMDEQSYASVLAAQFDSVTAENAMKWEPLQPEPRVWRFEPADALVAFARAHRMRVRGHALVWHNQLPSWVSEQMSREELAAALEEHVTAAVAHFRGKVAVWDVVNEALINSGDGLRPTLFERRLGDGYIAQAFRAARAADPGALLFYNDFGAEGLGPKSDRVFALMKALRAEGVPVDGVGLQMHLDASKHPSAGDIRANIHRLGELGLVVEITEMDVRLRGLAGARAARLEAQRALYRDVAAACVEEPACKAITLWGFTDAHSWIHSFFGADEPLPFDEMYAPKPAFYGLRDALWSRQR